MALSNGIPMGRRFEMRAGKGAIAWVLVVVKHTTVKMAPMHAADSTLMEKLTVMEMIAQQLFYVHQVILS